MTDEITTEVAEDQQTTETAAEPNAAPANDAPADKPDDGALAEGAVDGTIEAPEGEQAEDEAPTKGELELLREQLAGEDEGMKKALGRYKTVDAIRKAFKEARNAAKQVGKPLTLSESASEDEVKAYREAMGIPDEASDYPVAFSEGFQGTEADGELLDGFKAYMHAENVDPRSANAAVKWFEDFQAEQSQALDARLSAVAKETQSALIAEWGGEYDGNLSAASELMKSNLGEEGYGEMLNLRLADGSRLQDNLPFVKMMAQLGGDYYGGTAIMSGDVETTSRTVQEKIDAGLELRNTDSAKYFSDAHQAEMTRLYAQRAKLQRRK